MLFDPVLQEVISDENGKLYATLEKNSDAARAVLPSAPIALLLTTMISALVWLCPAIFIDAS